MIAVITDSQNWFLTHGRVAATPASEPLLLYFNTLETDVRTPNLAARKAEPVETPFQADVGPLRVSRVKFSLCMHTDLVYQFRGTVHGSQVDVELGLVPDPSVYYKLESFAGDLSQGPIIKEFDNVFYKGKVTLEKGSGFDGSGFHANGLLDLLGKVDWIGLGTKVAGAVLPLILP